MNRKNILNLVIIIVLITILNSCKTNTNLICVYGIDSLTNGANGKSFRSFFDKEYKDSHQNSELGFVHIDYGTSKDLDIGYWKSSGGSGGYGNGSQGSGGGTRTLAARKANPDVMAMQTTTRRKGRTRIVAEKSARSEQR